MKWKLWKYNGRYIQGDLISQHTSEAAALKRAKKEIEYVKAVKDERPDEIVIWLDGEGGTPLGIITKSKKKKAKK